VCSYLAIFGGDVVEQTAETVVRGLKVDIGFDASVLFSPVGL
jgi:hypothetical protein